MFSPLTRMSVMLFFTMRQECLIVRCKSSILESRLEDLNYSEKGSSETYSTRVICINIVLMGHGIYTLYGV